MSRIVGILLAAGVALVAGGALVGTRASAGAWLAAIGFFMAAAAIGVLRLMS